MSPVEKVGRHDPDLGPLTWDHNGRNLSDAFRQHLEKKHFRQAAVEQEIRREKTEVRREMHDGQITRSEGTTKLSDLRAVRKEGGEFVRQNGGFITPDQRQHLQSELTPKKSGIKPEHSPPASHPDPGQHGGLYRNAGGVLQARAINGINLASKDVVNVGGGTSETYNITNATTRTESFTYSDREGRKATITLQPGETGTFRAPSNAVGVRISPSDARGNTHPDEEIDETGATIAPGADPNAIQPQTLNSENQDISAVDGHVDFGGNRINMTVTLGDGKFAGDGDPIHAYAYSTDDAASMGLADDPSMTANIVVSDG